MTAKIVEKALDEAVLNRKIDNGLILHTDLGLQYISNEYEEKRENKYEKYSMDLYSKY
ncbi:hypothetical protein [Enterococcus faecalis]|uniref:hypothetical protein n=1 Tax=Enterococcus faecalis TaxID=1351 RepID=UPI000459603C|nr:hypothetical protein [Enterococcus faecalis]KAJ82174.1 hypothetical protein P791_2848 [Enterococcus faecalis NY9]